MAEKKYYIRIHSTLVPVTREVYKAYHSQKRSEKTLREKDERNGLVSYNALDTTDILGEEIVHDAEAESVEDNAVNNILREKLHLCIERLSEADQELLDAIYFKEMTERKYAEILGISQAAINKRHHKALSKLKILMKK